MSGCRFWFWLSGKEIVPGHICLREGYIYRDTVIHFVLEVIDFVKIRLSVWHPKTHSLPEPVSYHLELTP